MTHLRTLLLVLASGCAVESTGGADEPVPSPTATGDEVDAPAIPYTVIDAMPAFWSFWARAEPMEAREAFGVFEETLLAEHPELYTPAALGFDPDDDGALYARFEPWFAELPASIPRLRELDGSFEETLRRITRRFQEAIPELAWDGDVYLFVSLDSFNGAGRMVAGEVALLFGLDVIAKLDAGGASAMPPEVLVSHELFHMHQVFPEEESLSAFMWIEGLATYASGALNPQVGVDQLLPEGHLHDPADPQLLDPERTISWETDMPRYERELAAELLAVLDSDDREAYATFFMGRASPRLGERPVRSGYYFGYRIARELAGDRSLHELSQLDVDALEGDLRRILERIAAGDAAAGVTRRR